MFVWQKEVLKDKNFEKYLLHEVPSVTLGLTLAF